MKILIVASDKGEHFVPFIEEQIMALEALGIQVVRYGITGHGIMGYLHELPTLKRMIRKENPDLIHAHYGLSGVLANLQRSVPVVTTYHGSDINVPKILRFSKIAMRLSAWNIFVSKRNIAIAQPKDRYTLLPCGVNLFVFSSYPMDKQSDVVNILFSGAFNNAVKDPLLAQQAIRLLSSEDTPINLIELKGYTREKVAALMNSCNALLLTSKTEGSPQVIKEAMACGCPIVSVDVGDVAERTEGVDGCYVVSTREPADIAEALQKAIAFEGKTNGRERIIEMGLSNEQVAERLMEIYESIV